MIKSMRFAAFVACMTLAVSFAMPQGGKTREEKKEQGKSTGSQSQGRSNGGQSTGSQGRSTGGSQSTGSQGRSNGGSQSGQLGSQNRGQGQRSTGGGQSSGGSSGGSLGRQRDQGTRTTGGGQSSGGSSTGSSGGSLGRQRDQGTRTSGGGQSSGGSSTGSSGGSLGRQRDQGTRTTGGGQSSGSSSTGSLGRQRDQGTRTTGGGQTSGGGTLGRGSRDQDRTTGGGQTGGGLGRIDNVGNRNNNVRSIDQGRLGRTNYGTNNNLGNSGRSVNIQSPRLNLNKGSIASQVFRSETIRVNNGWRQGYNGYNNGWRDDNFCYPHYVFNPWGNNWNNNYGCTVSPWYYYPHLPGYMYANRVQWYDNILVNWGIGQIYNWNGNGNGNWNSGYGYGNDRDYDRNRDLDEAVYDLQRAFERRDRRALGRLIPNRGRVNIYMDSSYVYSLNSDDFYDLMLDNIEYTDTVRYQITRVRTYRGEAQVSATHEYYDSWGSRRVVYHHYRLEDDRYGYSITDFLTSGRP